MLLEKLIDDQSLQILLIDNDWFGVPWSIENKNGIFRAHRKKKSMIKFQSDYNWIPGIKIVFKKTRIKKLIFQKKNQISKELGQLKKYGFWEKQE